MQYYSIVYDLLGLGSSPGLCDLFGLGVAIRVCMLYQYTNVLLYLLIRTYTNNNNRAKINEFEQYLISN